MGVNLFSKFSGERAAGHAGSRENVSDIYRTRFNWRDNDAIPVRSARASVSVTIPHQFESEGFAQSRPCVEPAFTV